MFYSKVFLFLLQSLISILSVVLVLLQHQKCLVKGEDAIVNNKEQFQAIENVLVKSGLYYGQANGWNYYPGYYPGYPGYQGQGQIGIPAVGVGAGSGVICGGVPESICSDNCFNQGYTNYYCEPSICYCYTQSPGSNNLG